MTDMLVALASPAPKMACRERHRIYASDHQDSLGHFVGQRRWLQGQQFRSFQEAAEIFLAGDVERPFFVGEAEQGFVFHLKPFEPHDADVFLALFPDLALAQFHGHSIQTPRPRWRQDYGPKELSR